MKEEGMKIAYRLSLGTLLILALLATFGLVACGGGGGHADSATTEAPPPPPPPPAPATWEKDGLTVTAMPGSPEYPGAILTIDGLENGANLPSGTYAFDFAAANYGLGEQTSDAATKGIANSAQGQHIHLILNNGPYSAHYEAGFEKELEDGHHVMLAFLSRSYHESVKSAGAAVIKQFTVGGAEAQEVDLSAPHLFYSRPKGTYKGGDIGKLMLDFFLVNTEISEAGNKVRATINGTEFTFSEWVPYVIEGLSPGEVTIRLELIDAEGNPVPGPYNDVTRTVTLEANLI